MGLELSLGQKVLLWVGGLATLGSSLFGVGYRKGYINASARFRAEMQDYKTEYTEIKQEYDSLSIDYTELKDKYEDLKQRYEKLNRKKVKKRQARGQYDWRDAYQHWVRLALSRDKTKYMKKMFWDKKVLERMLSIPIDTTEIRVIKSRDANACTLQIPALSRNGIEYNCTIDVLCFPPSDFLRKYWKRKDAPLVDGLIWEPIVYSISIGKYWKAVIKR